MGAPREELARAVFQGLRARGLLDESDFLDVHSAVIAALPGYDAYRDARLRGKLAAEIERVWIELWWKTNAAGATYG